MRTKSPSWRLGPNHNHKLGQEYQWSYSGSGYNRVRLCSCGAEDHAPSFISTIDNAELEALRRDAEQHRKLMADVEHGFAEIKKGNYTTLSDFTKEVSEEVIRDAERWRAIAPYLTAGKIGEATCVSLSHIFHFDGELTAEQVVDRLVEEARKKP